jgi:superfamily II DNA/RNA helicase
MTFADLGLSDELLRAVGESGYDEPTPIQRQAIPSVLMNKDLVGIAQTGTGKTAAFVLPMIDILGEGRSRARMPRSLILEPTRELAAQVAENFDKYGKYHKLSMALLIGGTNMADQIKKLEKGVDVLIATPGRLMDLFGRGKIMLNGCNLLVIDEADRMLDMGFIPDIEKSAPSCRPAADPFFGDHAGADQEAADKFLTNPRASRSPPAPRNLLIDQRSSGPAQEEDVLVCCRAPRSEQRDHLLQRKTTVRELAPA